MKRSGWVCLVSAVCLVLGAARTDAAIITFNSLAGWSGAVGPYGTETFDGFAVDASYQGVSVGLAGGMSVTGTAGLNGAVTQKIDAAPFEFGGFYDINGTTELLGDLDNTNSTRFDFGVPLTAWSVETNGIANGGKPTDDQRVRCEQCVARQHPDGIRRIWPGTPVLRVPADGR